MIKVSVIIPVWNQEKLILKCLDSIPTRDDLEVIVINDKSTDGTLSTILNYPCRWNKLVVINQHKNTGPGPARDFGVRISQGDRFYFLDSDDWLLTDNWSLVVDRLDSEYRNYDIVKVKCERNNGGIDRYGTSLNNAFIRKSIVGDITHKYKMYDSEDCDFGERLVKEKSPTQIITPEAGFHYNYPREKSLSWYARKKITFKVD